MEEILENLRQIGTYDLLLKFGELIIWMVFILILSWVIRKSISKSITNNEMRYRLRKIVGLVTFVLIALLVVMSVTANLKYFSIAIGIVGAGVAFAMQEWLLSIAGWVVIYSNNTYRTGDRIEIEGVKGDVIDIGITKTTLMEIGEWVRSDNYNGRIVQLSNSFVFKGPVRNYSTDFPFVWDEIVLPIKYGSDIDLCLSVIQKTADAQLLGYSKFAKEHWDQMLVKYRIENTKVEPTVTLKLTDNWIEFTLRFVVDYKTRKNNKHQLHRSLIDAIQGTDGAIELASATFEITGLPNVKVDVVDKKS